MGKNKKTQLTHAEIWDDSALVQSWDDAVEEYELYHSVHAKGENLEEVLKEAEESGATEAIQAADEPTSKVGDDVAQPKDEDIPMNVDEQPSASGNEPVVETTQPAATSGPGVPTPDTSMPHPIMATVQDEALKNLMMSWYYAGYYTGLYEGQQQANHK
ncbi:hypothetical protein N7535_004458 [Penicillium sp. DV-2018c]|nr:hypothetical protein N7461_008042 [Penicillium sp. DV-2018c]KAJ5570798.1 hypothetical protein N7535_004458 [Penicillium sp. DV-2018c]